MIKHIVMWKVCKGGTAEDRAAVYATFSQMTEHLRGIIPEIIASRVGINCAQGDVFHVCIDSVFNSLEELSRYLDHPEHLKVRTYMNSVCYDKVIFDYEY